MGNTKEILYYLKVKIGRVFCILPNPQHSFSQRGDSAMETSTLTQDDSRLGLSRGQAFPICGQLLTELQLGSKRKHP